MKFCSLLFGLENPQPPNFSTDLAYPVVGRRKKKKGLDPIVTLKIETEGGKQGRREKNRGGGGLFCFPQQTKLPFLLQFQMPLFLGCAHCLLLWIPLCSVFLGGCSNRIGGCWCRGKFPPTITIMGCINSKNAVAGASSPPPPVDARDGVEVLPASTKGNSGLLVLQPKTSSEDNYNRNNNKKKKKFSKNGSKKSSGSFSFRLGFTHRYVEAEQNAAGWPPWLTAAAAEAVQGWIPLKADSFQKLDKVSSFYYCLFSILHVACCMLHCTIQIFIFFSF